LMCLRVQLAEFRTVFMPHVKIEHLDVITPYTEWKQKVSGDIMRRYQEVVNEYKNGDRDIYYAGIY